MKVYIQQADLQLSAEFQIHVNHKPAAEQTFDSPNELPANVATSWLGVKAGDSLTVQGHIEGNFRAATVDFLVDGIFMGSKKFDSGTFAVPGRKYRANLITGLARFQYDRSERTELCEMTIANLYQDKSVRLRICPPGMWLNVGRIEIIISAQAASNDSYDNDRLNCKSYDWRHYEQGEHSGAIVPRHNIRLFERRASQPEQAKAHHEDQFRERPGKAPLAKLVFHYRNLEDLVKSGRFSRSIDAVIKLRPVSADDDIAIGLITPRSPISDQNIQRLDSSDLFVSEDEGEVDDQLASTIVNKYGRPTTIGAIASQTRDLSADGNASNMQAKPAGEVLTKSPIPHNDHMDQAKLSLRPARPTMGTDNDEQPIDNFSAILSHPLADQRLPDFAATAYLGTGASPRHAVNVSSEYDITAPRTIEMEKIPRTAIPPLPMVDTGINPSLRSPPRDPRLRRPRITMPKDDERITYDGKSNDLPASHRSPLTPPSDPRSFSLSTHHDDSEPSARQASDMSRKHAADSTDSTCVPTEPAKRPRIDAFVVRKKELVAQDQHRRALRLKREKLHEERLQREIAELEKELQHEDDLLRDLLLSEDGEAMCEDPVFE